MKKLYLILFLLLILSSSAFSSVYVKDSFTKELMPNTFYIGAELKFEGIAIKPHGKWQDNDGDIIPVTNGTVENKFSISDNESLMLTFGIMPTEYFKCQIEAKVIGNYAKRYYQSVNLDHYMKDHDEIVKITRGELKYVNAPWSIGLFYGIGHASWEGDYDLFNIFPAQTETERYLRTGGKPTPQWAEVNYNAGIHIFTLIIAPELTWGAPPTFIAKYNLLDNNRVWTVIYKEESVDWGDTENTEEFDEDWGDYRKKYWYWINGEHFRDISLTLKTPFLYIIDAQMGIVFSPNRIDQSYTYIEETKSQLGYLESKYIIKEDKIKETDALGGRIVVQTKEAPFFNNIQLSGTYLMPVAGNLKEIKLGLGKSPARKCHLDTELIYKEPVIGPLPYLYEGTENNKGPVVLTPRGPEAPFTVFYNRKSYIASVVFLFDSTSGWFYQWKHNVVAEWNVNKNEKGPSFVLNYRIHYFPTATDLRCFVAKDEGTGKMKLMWDSGSYGIWAVKRPLHSITFLNVLTFVPDIRTIFVFEIYESTADTGWAYMDNGVTREWPQFSAKPVTNPLFTSIKIEKGSLFTRFAYGHNIWGHEECDRQFGRTIDDFYNASLGINLAHSEMMVSKINLEYYGQRESDNKYINLPSYDEIRLSYTLKSSMLFSLQ